MSFVTAQSTGLRVSLRAHIAFVRFLAGVDPLVFVQVVLDAERLAAVSAGVGLFAGVDPLMLGQRVGLREALVAHVACVRFLLGVDAQVTNVVVVQIERLVAVLADVLVFAGVLSFVQRQGIGVGKRFRAVWTFVLFLWFHWFRRRSSGRWICGWCSVVGGIGMCAAAVASLEAVRLVRVVEG